MKSKVKIHLQELKVQSFITGVTGKSQMAGADQVAGANQLLDDEYCGVTLCPPCTRDPLNCLLSRESMCMTCHELTDHNLA